MPECVSYDFPLNILFAVTAETVTIGKIEYTSALVNGPGFIQLAYFLVGNMSAFCFLHWGRFPLIVGNSMNN